MSTVVPPRFLFRWCFPVPYLADFPGEDTLQELPAQCTLPSLQGFDGTPEHAQWRLGWNEAGLALQVDVRGKSEPVQCDVSTPATTSGVHVWFDTRPAQNVHRATRFCHRFAFLPAGLGRTRQQPSAVLLPLGSSASEPRGSTEALRVSSHLRDDGYRLQAWIPAECLIGFDPAAQPRLGFYGVIRDHEWGEQALTVGPPFPYETDPSLWQLLELIRQ